MSPVVALVAVATPSVVHTFIVGSTCCSHKSFQTKSCLLSPSYGKLCSSSSVGHQRSLPKVDFHGLLLLGAPIERSWAHGPSAMYSFPCPLAAFPCIKQMSVMGREFIVCIVGVLAASLQFQSICCLAVSSSRSESESDQAHPWAVRAASNTMNTNVVPVRIASCPALWHLPPWISTRSLCLE